MAARGMFFGEGPTACPFVALESDRDRRSDEPDHRHRCYAEPDPAPRALAHQRAYCLSAAFTTCPIFQDWAIRAAATPVPLRPGRMGDTERDEHPAWAEPPPWLADSDAESVPEQPSAAEEAHAVGGAGAAEAPRFIAPPERQPADVERVPSLPRALGEEPHGAEPEKMAQPGPAAEPQPEPEVEPAPEPEPEPEPAREPEPQPGPEPEPEPSRPPDAPLPAFLASRADQVSEQRAARPDRASRLPHEALRREDVVPAWGRNPVHGQTRSRISLGGTGDVLSKITTVLAIGAILALAVVVIILAPSLLGFLDGDGPGATVPGGGAASPTLVAPTASPTPASTPSPSPQTYTVQAGDTLFSIARRHGLTVEQLLAANPQVTNPNLVQIGQVLIIPDDDFGLFSPSPSP